MDNDRDGWRALVTCTVAPLAGAGVWAAVVWLLWRLWRLVN